MPTGASVAALTTSLPETPGGMRNGDYRYTWIRDSTWLLRALHYLLLAWEADEFMQFMSDLDRNEGRRPADHAAGPRSDARLVRAASPLGLFAEEFDAETGGHLGNFPQAFSHLALVEAAARIVLAASLAEVAA